MSESWRPTELVDARTRVERAAMVGAMERRMCEYPLWQKAGDGARRSVARRIVFTKRLVEMGEIGEGEHENAAPGHERRGWEGL